MNWHGVTETSYRGFPLVVGEEFVTVYAPDGRKVDRVRAFSTARRVVRGYLREQRNERSAA